MVNNIEEAKEHINKIKEGLIKNPFYGKDTVESLKVFADAEDEENFKFIVNSLIEGIKTQKGYELFRDKPLAYIELFCMVMDHGGDKVSYNGFQAQRGIKTEKLPIGNTQKFFQRIYGSHYYAE